MPLIMSVRRIFIRLLSNLKTFFLRFMLGRSPNMCLVRVTFIWKDSFAKCMMRLNMHVGHLRMKETNTQKKKNSELNTKNISNSHVFSSDKNESKRTNRDKIL